MIRTDQKITKIEFRNLEFSVHPACTLTFLVINVKMWENLIQKYQM